VKILFFMPHPGATRNFESTLRGLADRGHLIHLAFDRTEKKNLPGLWDLADSLMAEYPGITAGEHPRPPETDWSIASSRLRASVDYMRYSNPEFVDAPKLQSRAERWVTPRTKQVVSRVPHRAKGRLRAAFSLAERSAPIDGRLARYLREQQPSVILLTPLLEPGSVQTDYLRVAKRMNIPTCLCVHSWDNLTNKGLIHEQPDAVTVWNEMQRDEAVQLHGTPRERVVVTGAAAYDHWFGWTPSRSRLEFAAQAGLDPDRAFIVYLGSSGFIAPDEAAFIVEWMRELHAEGLGDIQVLARPHPQNPLRGPKPSQIELARIGNVKLYPPAGANPTDKESRQDYFDSLYYCSAVTGVNTSAFLESAILGRPVLTMLAPRYTDTQTGMLHFHHLLTAGGGLLHVATNYHQHAAQLRKVLAASQPDECVSERSVNFTRAFIRPYGLDEPGTERMVATIEGLPARSRSANQSAGDGRTPAEQIAGRLLANSARLVVKRARHRARLAKQQGASTAKQRKASKSGGLDASVADSAIPRKAKKPKRRPDGRRADRRSRPKAPIGAPKMPRPERAAKASTPSKAKESFAPPKIPKRPKRSEPATTAKSEGPGKAGVGPARRSRD
jgi:hypothetical protein